MKFQATTIGCDEEYGERKVVAEDDDIGEIAVREMEFGSVGELVRLSEDVERIEIEESSWDKYAADVTFIGEGVDW